MTGDTKVKWTLEDRNKLWTAYVDSKPEDNYFWFTMCTLFKRSEKSLRTEVWKIHQSRDARAYWKEGDRLYVVYLGNRCDKEWTPMDDLILRASAKDGLPFTRIADLLGRDHKEVVTRFALFKSEGRKPMFPELEVTNG